MKTLSKAQQLGLVIWEKVMVLSAGVAMIAPFFYELLCDAQGLSGVVTMMVVIPVVTLSVGAMIGIIPFVLATIIRLLLTK